MRRPTRPSPAVVVAILALVAAVAGTAVADPLGAISKLTKKKVVRIAKTQIAHAAPDLSVAHADTAGRADTAGNADTVGGKTTVQLQTTSAYTEGFANLPMTAAQQEILSTTIESAGGRVVAQASLEIDGHTDNADDDLNCRIRIAGVDGLSLTQATPDTVIGMSESATMSLTSSATPAAGTVPVSVRCGNESGNVVVEQAELSVISTPP